MWPVDGLAVSARWNTKRAFGNVFGQHRKGVISDGAGGLYIGWTEGSFLPYEYLYTVRLRPDGRLATGWPSQGILIAGPPHIQEGASLTPDGEGGVYVSWNRWVNHYPGDIFTKRLTASGEVAPGWPQEGVGVCTVPGPQQAVDVVPDGLGGTLFVWSDYRTPLAGDLYSQRILPNGHPASGWEPGGNLISTAPGLQEFSALVSAGDGGGLVAFVNLPSYKVYAQRVTASGGLLPDWTLAGVPLAPVSAGRWRSAWP
jgi:hypothetical protein